MGLLDEEFFMYGEDIDLSYRLLKGGWENWYMPAPIVHYKGESTHKSSFRYVHVFYEAMLIFFKKHYSAASLWLTIPIKIAIYAKATTALAGMLTDKARRMMGFFGRGVTKFPEYVFIGSKAMLDECRQLADAKGLVAKFIEGNATTGAVGHANLDLEKNETMTYVVYDTDTYSYEQIMQQFSNRPMENIGLATYDPHTKVLITAENVIV